MKIAYVSILVGNQEQALKFYQDKLGFVVKQDIPMGEFRWLTLVSPEDPNGTELLLEPNQHPAAQAFQKALKADNIPLNSFGVKDTQKEYDRLTALGVQFTQKPTPAGPTVVARFDDTCGNLIQLHQL